MRPESRRKQRDLRVLLNFGITLGSVISFIYSGNSSNESLLPYFPYSETDYIPIAC